MQEYIMEKKQFIQLVVEKAMAPHSSTLAWKIPWMEELVGCRPWGPKESDSTEQLHFHFSLSCTGEGNGNPLQCSCLENPRNGGAWWAAIYGVAQSRTWLKWLSSSSINNIFPDFWTKGPTFLFYTELYKLCSQPHGSLSWDLPQPLLLGITN